MGVLFRPVSAGFRAACRGPRRGGRRLAVLVAAVAPVAGPDDGCRRRVPARALRWPGARGRWPRWRAPRGRPVRGRRHRGARAAVRLVHRVQRRLHRLGRQRRRLAVDVRHRPGLELRHRRDRDHDELDRATSTWTATATWTSPRSASGGNWTSGRIQTTSAERRRPGRRRTGGHRVDPAAHRRPRLLARVLDARARASGRRTARSTSWRTSTRCPRSPAPCTAAPTRAARATRPTASAAGCAPAPAASPVITPTR